MTFKAFKFHERNHEGRMLLLEQKQLFYKNTGSIETSCSILPRTRRRRRRGAAGCSSRPRVRPGGRRVNSILALIPPGIKRLAVAILVVGFGAATTVYWREVSKPVGWTSYQPEDSKRYLHDMELYGGKGNLLAGDFRQWFASLWHGRNLAFTIAFLTILAALAVLFFGTPLPPAAESADQQPTGSSGAGRESTG